jgi:phenylpropionate dioxygenase-like ring-hydroxylating dioxygenase large terminal subunit
MTMAAVSRQWPAQGLARVPYWVYSDHDLYAQEQERIFRGPTWNFLCLEAELPGPNTYCRSSLGDMSVVVARDNDGAVHAFENRCAHRGSLLCLNERGAAKEIVCVYHNWTYDLAGNLTGVAFRRGLGGKGGMPKDATPEAHGPRKLRVETLAGLVFGTLSPETPPLAEYLGAEILGRVRRVMRAPVKLLGGYSQMLPNNWKLYMENVKDSYHASLLHAFFTTFRLHRLSQQAGMRSAQDDFQLEAPELLETVDEFGDGIGIQILGVFPSFVLQQIRNSLAVRRVVPQGIEKTELVWTCFGFTSDDEALTELRLRQANLIGPAGYVSMEDGAATGFVQRSARTADDELSVVEMGGHGTSSEDNRVTEAAVRGFWKDYRAHVGL